ncbi:hypothetical protein F5X99DRAFT_198503 [Biscogniauxia marginata]|nr:hypothetical protein F5X99DRAFT_198503 [Biscogniauxia marginata]
MTHSVSRVYNDDAVMNNCPNAAYSYKPSMALESHIPSSSEDALSWGPQPSANIDCSYNDLPSNQVSIQKDHDIDIAVATDNSNNHSFGARPASTLSLKTSCKRSASDDDQATHDIGHQFLACPFYKRDSRRYSDCRNHVLRRIKDVKQHVNRKHQKPKFYCPLCFQIFKSATTRDEHIQLKRCVSQLDPIYDGISEDQRMILSQSSSRGKTTKEQWCDMWKTIFPKIEPPKSPYLGSDGEETVSLIRSVWHKRQHEIISETIKTEGVSTIDHTLLVNLVERVLDQLELDASGTIISSDRPCSHEFRIGSVAVPEAIHQGAPGSRPQESWTYSPYFDNMQSIYDNSNNTLWDFEPIDSNSTLLSSVTPPRPSEWADLGNNSNMDLGYLTDRFMENTTMEFGTYLGSEFLNNPNSQRIQQFTA